MTLDRRTRDPYVNLFGRIAFGAPHKAKKLVGYTPDGEAVYRFELTTTSGMFHYMTATADGMKYTSEIVPTRRAGGTSETLPGQNFGQTQPVPIGRPFAVGAPDLDPNDLNRAKADLTAWVNQYAHIWGDEDLRNKISQINKATKPSQLQAMQSDWKNILRFQPSWDPIFGDPTGVDIGGLGGGRGGGGGSLGPQYRAPDRRVVESFVKGELVTLVGGVPDGEVERLVNLYMADHRRNFDSLSVEIDPGTSVREAIRQTDRYKRIHQNRPESADEERWIADRRQAAAQGGLNVGLQEDFAIEQAQVAGDVPDVIEAAGVAQFQATGNVRGTTMENKMRSAVQNVFAGVVR